MRSRLHTVLLALVLATSATMSLAPAVLAGGPVVPMPGELVLTDAERALVMRTMSRNERRLIAPLLDDRSGLVVGYTRRHYRIVVGPDGAPRPEPMFPAGGSPASVLSLPARAFASSATKPGTDLYVSLSVIRTRNSSPYEWQVVPYFEWSGLDGMNHGNSSADTMAVAWAGSATYLHSQRGNGQQTPNWPCNRSPIDIWPSDGTPNVGTAWSFHEWGYWWGCPAWWGMAEIRLRETSWQGRTDNIVYRYYHTYGGLQYSFGFSRSPGITITPTAEQWSITVFGAYRH